jgi:hypothetical protein
MTSPMVMVPELACYTQCDYKWSFRQLLRLKWAFFSEQREFNERMMLLDCTGLPLMGNQKATQTDKSSRVVLIRLLWCLRIRYCTMHDNHSRREREQGRPQFVFQRTL